MKKITKTALVADAAIPIIDFETDKSAKAVWVPNRNALFLNIAACYCDTFNYNHIIFGANKEEARNFPDNTEEFRAQLTNCFTKSTLVHPKVVAPLINYSKNDIVRIAVEESMPLELVRSCYSSGEMHCGKCESCYYLKKALTANKCSEYLKILFDYDED